MIPAEITLTAAAERGPEGETLVVGQTNLPDGTKLWVYVKQPTWMPKVASPSIWGIAGDANVIVRNGTFRTQPLWIEIPNKDFTAAMKKWPDAANLKFRRTPAPAGKYGIWISANFTSGWQGARIVQLLGEGGKTLRGSVLKKRDPDVIDSDMEVDYTALLTFPNLSPEAESIALVKASRLNVTGLGRSATDTEANVTFFMTPGSGLKPREGWRAIPKGDKVYEVVFDYFDGNNPAQALWSANLKTREVKYVNSNAKSMSWTPDY